MGALHRVLVVSVLKVILDLEIYIDEWPYAGIYSKHGLRAVYRGEK